MDKTAGSLVSYLPGMPLILALIFTAAGCGFVEEGSPEFDDDPPQVRIQELNSLCTVQVSGYGTLDVETDYIPSVIACENGNAPLEALKAQAIAARTYAAYVTQVERRALVPRTRDQVYGCTNNPVREIHRQAARETAGQLLSHNGRVIASFYVAGAIPTGAECRARASDRDPTNTQRRVTYNHQRTGSQVRPTSLGSSTNPANRGAMSQNGSTCMANAGWGHQRILRYFYGDDIRLQTGPSGTCGIDAGTGPGVIAGDADCDDITDPFEAGVCQIAEPEDPDAVCASPYAAVRIMPRSAWNARAPRNNASPHTPDRISIHHTVTPSGRAHDNATLVRNIQHGHMTRSPTPFSDIGYHFLIAWDGTVYMGRPETQQGAHVLNRNRGNLGIALLGDFSSGGLPSDIQVKTTARLVRQLAEKYNIPINRTHIKGHGEQGSTECPGHGLRSRLNEIVEWANADTVCSGDEDEELEEEDDAPKYRYVRLQGVSEMPEGYNDTIDGYEVDSIYVEHPIPSGTSVSYPDAIVSSRGVSNPGAVRNAPDNTSCDNRAQTVAGVPVGAELIVRLPSYLKEGDILYVTQHEYQASISDCSSSGTVSVSVSEDGRSWKVLGEEVEGNYRLSLRAQHFELNADDEVSDDSDGFEFIVPRAGQWYRPDMKFRMHVTNPNIVRVQYHVEQYNLGGTTNRANNFFFEWEFIRFGERRIHAHGLDANGQTVASKEITVTVTRYDGTIPGGQTEPGAVPGAGAANINANRAERIASEAGKCLQPRSSRPGARCTNGTGGYSTGEAWMFVKGALDRAGVEWTRLQAGPCSGAFQRSSYGFRCNADANPTRLREIGFQRIEVPATQAPRGAIIGWDRGCLGHSSTHGSIQISMGNGIACSDHCGPIRGDATCASVYVPVN